MTSKLDIKTFVISLPHAVERRKKLQENLDGQLMTNYHFFDATYGPALVPEQITSIFSSLVRWTGHPHVYGCALSHIRIWQQVLNEVEPVLVLEDDVEIATDFSSKLHRCLQKVPSDFDMLYLGGIQSRTDDNIPFVLKCLQYSRLTRFGKKKCTWVTPNIYQPRVILGTHAYVITPKGAKKLLDSLLGRIYTHIDYMIMTVPDLQYYATYPFLAHQSVTLSSSGIASPTQFPFFINRKLDTMLQHESGVSWGYVLTTPVSQISGECVNIWTALFFFIGFVLYYRFRSPKLIAMVCLLWFGVDLLFEGLIYRNVHMDLKSLRSMLFSFLVLLIPAMLY